MNTPKQGAGKRLWTPGWKGLLPAAALAATLMLPLGASAESAADPAASRVDEVLNLLSKYHVSGTSEDTLSDAAIRGMVDSLNDPYTKYFSPEEWKQFENSLEQHFVGIGIRMGEDDRGAYIIEVFPGSPAEQGGMKPGDRIVGIDGRDVAGSSFDELSGYLRGDEDTKVNVSYERDGTVFKSTLTRKSISLPVVGAKRTNDGFGWITVASFSSDADELFAQRKKELEQQGIRGLVVDLRDNPGGLLDSAEGILKQFVPSGVLIHTKNRDKADEPVNFTGGSSVTYPVVVLVNENSASASEVLSGALQDDHAAKVVGTLTYGKGSVQQVMPLSNGGYLKITIEEYLTPNGHAVNKVGITPDVAVEGWLPQWLTAFREAGMSSLALTVKPDAVDLNGVSVDGTLSFIRENGHVYVPLRTLAALVGSEVVWDAGRGEAVLKNGAQEKRFKPEANASLASDTRLIDGTSYTDLSAFAGKYGGFSWTEDGDGLKLVSKKES